MYQTITLIILLTITMLALTSYVLIPLTKLLFNISLILIPFIIISIGCYLVFQQLQKRGKQ